MIRIVYFFDLFLSFFPFLYLFYSVWLYQSGFVEIDFLFGYSLFSKPLVETCFLVVVKTLFFDTAVYFWFKDDPKREMYNIKMGRGEIFYILSMVLAFCVLIIVD